MQLITSTKLITKYDYDGDGTTKIALKLNGCLVQSREEIVKLFRLIANFETHFGSFVNVSFLIEIK